MGIRTGAGIPLPGGGGSRMQLLPMASSPDGLISARYAVITKTPGWEGGGAFGARKIWNGKLWCGGIVVPILKYPRRV